ncbi:MAG: HAMP domain-containing protein [Nitrospirae bacterium]|nr:HAMP domain-containing protein [Nitrospirota bacterium]
MLKFKSLTAKLIFMGSVMLVFLTIYITATYTFSRHMSDEGTRINLAGQLRYRFFDMVWLVRRIIETRDTGLRDSAVMELKEKMNQFERTAKSIKNGDKEIGVKPLKYEKGLVILEKLFNEWDTTLNPMLLEMTEASEEKARILLDKYEPRIHGYAHEINSFVSFLGNDYKKDIKDFDKVRFYTLGFFFIATVFIILFARQSVIRPVRKLKDAAREIEKGNLDVRVDIKSRDEIGELGNAFNSMAQTRKHEEELLRQLHQQYKELVNTIDGIVWEADAKTFQFTFVSKQVERILGYPIEQWLKEPAFWKDHLHPEDRGWAVDFCVKATAEKEVAPSFR